MPIGRQVLEHFQAHGSSANHEGHQPKMTRIGQPEQQADSGKRKKPFAAYISDMRPQSYWRQSRKGDRQKRRPSQNN